MSHWTSTPTARLVSALSAFAIIVLVAAWGQTYIARRDLRESQYKGCLRGRAADDQAAQTAIVDAQREMTLASTSAHRGQLRDAGAHLDTAHQKLEDFYFYINRTAPTLRGRKVICRKQYPRPPLVG